MAIHVNAKSGGGSSGGGDIVTPTQKPDQGSCNKNDGDRRECGWFGIQEHQCKGKGWEWGRMGIKRGMGRWRRRV